MKCLPQCSKNNIWLYRFACNTRQRHCDKICRNRNRNINKNIKPHEQQQQPSIDYIGPIFSCLIQCVRWLLILFFFYFGFSLPFDPYINIFFWLYLWFSRSCRTPSTDWWQFIRHDMIHLLLFILILVRCFTKQALACIFGSQKKEEKGKQWYIAIISHGNGKTEWCRIKNSIIVIVLVMFIVRFKRNTMNCIQNQP